MLKYDCYLKGLCKGSNPNCYYWGDAPVCHESRKSMLVTCKRPCIKQCPSVNSNSTLSILKTQKVSDNCKDDHESCAVRAKTGECDRNPNYMLSNCTLSCKRCNESTNREDVANKEWNQDCNDTNVNCVWWADTGECQKNPGFMLANCKLSCQKCNSEKNAGNKKEEGLDPKIAGCKDNHSNCGLWAETGECQKNPGYMFVGCKLSCKQCNAKNTEENKKEEDPSHKHDCMDTNSNCGLWASMGECQRNPDYMLPNCKQSCNQCNKINYNLLNNSVTEDQPKESIVSRMAMKVMWLLGQN